MILSVILKFLKIAWPFLLAGAVYYIAFLQGSQHGQSKAHKDFIEQVAKLDKKKCPDCICNCPKVEACPDFDKIKGKNIEVNVHQNYISKFSGDSLFHVKLLHDFDNLLKIRMDERDLVRVKKR